MSWLSPRASPHTTWRSPHNHELRPPSVDLFLLAGNPLDVLAAAGIELGRTYPLPIVDRAKARKSALLGYEAMRVKAGA